jgi:hypothetical protein
MSGLLFSSSHFLAAARKDDVLFSIDFSTFDFMCPYKLTVPRFHFGRKLIISCIRCRGGLSGSASIRSSYAPHEMVDETSPV